MTRPKTSTSVAELLEYSFVRFCATFWAVAAYGPSPDVSSRFCTDTSTQGVLMTPGSTITTSMPLSFSSSLRQSLSPYRAFFVTLYHAQTVVYLLTPIEDLFTILSDLFFLNSGLTMILLLGIPNRINSSSCLSA